MPSALLNGAISTHNLKQIAYNEGISPMLIAERMINSNFTINAHWGKQTFILPQQRTEHTGRDVAGTL